MHLIHARSDPRGVFKTKRYLFPIYQIKERLKGWQWGLVETLAEDLNGWATAILSNSEPPIGGYDGWEAVRIAHSAKPLGALAGSRKQS